MKMANNYFKCQPWTYPDNWTDLQSSSGWKQDFSLVVSARWAMTWLFTNTLAMKTDSIVLIVCLSACVLLKPKIDSYTFK